MTRGTTLPAGDASVPASLLAIHSAACAMAERVGILLKEAVALERQLSRIISSRTEGTRKNSGTVRSKASARNVTAVRNKPKRTSKGARAKTDGRLVDAAARSCGTCAAMLRAVGRLHVYLPRGPGRHLVQR